MKASEIREKTNAELEQELLGFKEELFRLRFQQATGKLTNTSRMREIRRDVARVKTIMRERQLAKAAESR